MSGLSNNFTFNSNLIWFNIFPYIDRRIKRYTLLFKLFKYVLIHDKNDNYLLKCYSNYPGIQSIFQYCLITIKIISKSKHLQNEIRRPYNKPNTLEANTNRHINVFTILHIIAPSQGSFIAFRWYSLCVNRFRTKTYMEGQAGGLWVAFSKL